MFQYKEGIIFNTVFIPKYEGLSDYNNILEELKSIANDNDFTFKEVFICFPKNDGLFTPIDTWKIKIKGESSFNDMPIPIIYYPYIYNAIKIWAIKHIHTNQKLSLIEGRHYIKNCTVRASEKTQIKAYGFSRVTAHQGAHIVAFDNTIVHAYEWTDITAYDNTVVHTFTHVGEVDAWHNSTVIAHHGSTITALDNCKIETHGGIVIIPSWSLAQEEQISLCDDAILINYKNNTITTNKIWNTKNK